ncbi:uncharacterized protein N0V89_001691 [Didymosphaeria variabile]|uniref:VOC domain-containing protein n=1 Tax=Didymosphaeria variabile TaxID=1932322 RepID=A0A9W8XZ72_9PLEO|nr:uncharacterized protein N0V89_001691 [Didymosphaeria variabile]KAJ4361122.1 hypothetical protein N0V89_001691 [Didymosphaeria variabile]
MVTEESTNGRTNGGGVGDIAHAVEPAAQDFSFMDLAAKITIVRMGHVYYKHKDVERAQKFLEAFGLTETKRAENKFYYRGYGTEPFVYCAEKADEDAFGGVGVIVESIKDLVLARKIIPTASQIYELKDTPGGGQCVTFTDPVDGFPFHLVYGQTPIAPSADYPFLEFNFVGRNLKNVERFNVFPNVKQRHAGQYQRFQKGPAPVHKLGHFGICVTNFEQQYKFYTTKFNLKPSDVSIGADSRDPSLQ